MKKYLAIFPGVWGDEIRRTYKTRGRAITEAKKHLAACQDCNTSHFAEVWEYMPIGGKELIYIADTNGNEKINY